MPVGDGILAVFLGDEVERRVGEIEVQQHGFCAIVAFGTAEGEEGLTRIGAVFRRFGEDVEGGFGEGSLVLIAFVPGAGGKDANGVCTGFQVIQDDRLIRAKNWLVGLVIQNKVQVVAQPQLLVFEQRQIAHLKLDGCRGVLQDFVRARTEDRHLGLIDIRVLLEFLNRFRWRNFRESGLRSRQQGLPGNAAGVTTAHHCQTQHQHQQRSQ